jgi:sec-independent protein translocase protein TatA
LADPVRKEGAFVFNISKELIIVLVIVLVIFGPSQLPKLAKTFGKTMKTLKDGMEGTTEDEDDAEPAAVKASAEEPVAPKPAKTPDADPL